MSEIGVLRVFPPVGPQHADREVEADQALAVANRIQLAVRQVARHWRDRMHVGVADDERLVGDVGHVPEAFFRDVRQIDHDAQPVAFGHQPLARVGQARPGIRARRIGERHAMREDVVAAPHRPQRPQARRVEHLECRKIRIDRLAALHVEHRREDAVLHGGFDVGGVAAEFPAAGAFDPERDGSHVERDVERRLPFQRFGERRGIVSVLVGLVEVERARRDVDGAEPAGEPAGLGASLVDMPAGATAVADGLGPFDEFPDRVRSLRRVVPEAIQHVVVAVENVLHQAYSGPGAVSGEVPGLRACSLLEDHGRSWYSCSFR